MHFAVQASLGAIRIKGVGTVVVDPGHATLEEGRHNHHPQLASLFGKQLEGAPTQGFCQFKMPMILILTEIVTGTQLRQAEDGGSCFGGLGHPLLTLGKVLFRPLIQTQLDHGDGVVFHDG